jgi:hypothetical protein
VGHVGGTEKRIFGCRTVSRHYSWGGTLFDLNHRCAHCPTKRLPCGKGGTAANLQGHAGHARRRGAAARPPPAGRERTVQHTGRRWRRLRQQRAASVMGHHATAGVLTAGPGAPLAARRAGAAAGGAHAQPRPTCRPRRKCRRRAGRGRGGGTVRHAGRHSKGAGRGRGVLAAVPGAAGRRPRVHAGGGRALTWEAPPRRRSLRTRRLRKPPRPRTRRLRAWEE